MFDTASLVTLLINFLLFNVVICGIYVGTENDRPENVTVYFKSWPFWLVEKECQSNFLYDYGYTSILVSSVQDKKQSEDFEFNDLFKFQTPLGTIEEFAAMIKSCDKKGIKVYVSLKLITDKQIDRVIRRYEEIEPFLLQKRAKREKLVAKLRSKVQSSEQTKWDYASVKRNPESAASSTPVSKTRVKSNKKRFDENFMKKRQHKNTKYLMELVLLNASDINHKATSSLIRSFKAVNKRYRLAYKKNKILSEKSGVPELLRKYCKLKYKLEDISSAVRFIRFLMELGISGVRIENSEFVASSALDHILELGQKNIDKKLTVIFDDASNVHNYQRFGSIMDEEYARKLMSAVKTVNFNQLVSEKRIWPKGWKVPTHGRSRPYILKYMIPEDSNNKIDSYNFKIATSLMLTNPYGFPIIVSPFSRLKKRVSTLSNVKKMSIKDICDDGEFCIHRKKFIRQLVLFRLITADDKITSAKVLANNIMYLNRGDKGFSAFIHRMDPPNDTVQNENIILQTELPPGVYCNIITGYKDLKREECAPGSVFQIDKEKRLVIKKDAGYYEGVLTLDILSRLEYIDIKVNGELHVQNNPAIPVTQDSNSPIETRSIEDSLPISSAAVSRNEIALQPREVDETQQNSSSWISTLSSWNPFASSTKLRSHEIEIRVPKIIEKIIEFIMELFHDIKKSFKKIFKALTRYGHKYEHKYGHGYKYGLEYKHGYPHGYDPRHDPGYVYGR